MASLNEIIAYLTLALEGFETDPADSDYQEGYEEALNDVYNFVMEGTNNG